MVLINVFRSYPNNFLRKIPESDSTAGKTHEGTVSLDRSKPSAGIGSENELWTSGPLFGQLGSYQSNWSWPQYGQPMASLPVSSLLTLIAENIKLENKVKDLEAKLSSFRINEAARCGAIPIPEAPRD